MTSYDIMKDKVALSLMGLDEGYKYTFNLSDDDGTRYKGTFVKITPDVNTIYKTSRSGLLSILVNFENIIKYEPNGTQENIGNELFEYTISKPDTYPYPVNILEIREGEGEGKSKRRHRKSKRNKKSKRSRKSTRRHRKSRRR